MHKPERKRNLHFSACERATIRGAVENELKRLGFDVSPTIPHTFPSTLFHRCEQIAAARTVEQVILRVFHLGQAIGKGAYRNG